MRYTSITRDIRGYNYQTDWESATDWAKDMVEQLESGNEVEWSILVDVETASPTMKFIRTGVIEQIH